ncbi:MAG: sensor histidine kinase [Nitrospiraceae bacterium]
MALSRVALLAGLAVLYFLTGKLGLSLAFYHPSATAIWPPAGIALAALLIWGYGVWPAILAGAFFVNATTAGSLATSAAIAVGNTLEGLVGAFLVNRFAHGRNAFERPKDTLTFALAAMVSTLVSPALGVTSIVLGGYASWLDAWPIWLTWFLGDAAGALIVAPPLLLWSVHQRSHFDRAQVLEMTVLMLGVFLVGQIAFGGIVAGARHNYPISFLPVPFLVWAAVRFGPRETATVMILLSGIAVWGTLRGFGSFATEAPNQALLLLQAFMATIAIMAMVLASGISEQKRTERALRASEEELRAIFRSMSDVVLVLDARGRYVKIAPTNPSFLYLPAEELLGKTVHDVLPPTEADLVLAHIREALRAGEMVRAEYRLMIGGAEVWFDGTVSPLFEDTVLWVARDITARKRAEAQLHHLTQALERRVEERTASLKAANDQLQELYGLKSAFVSIVSHELRTPTTAIKGLVENLVAGLAGPLSDKQAYYLSRVQYNVERLTRMLNELLDLSRIEAGKISLRLAPTPVPELINDAIDGFRSLAQEKSIMLEGPLHAGIPSIVCDPDKVHQILTNLLENALKFTPSRGMVRVETEFLDDSFLQICVADTGCGIREDETGKLFDKFYRSRTTPSDTPGTGLGLAIAKSLVELHGGTIWAENRPEGGSRFCFTLPSTGRLSAEPEG